MKKSTMTFMFGSLLTSRIIPNPILIVGASRSGTSVMQAALGEHSQVIPAPKPTIESPLISKVGHFVASMDWTAGSNFAAHTHIAPSDMYPTMARWCFESVHGPDYVWRALRTVPTRGHLEVLKQRRWVIKSYPNGDALRGLKTVMPGVQVIYMLRNGLDVVHSHTKFALFRDQEFANHCRAWTKGVARYETLRNDEAVLLVRQEDLAAEPYATLHSVFDFLNLPYEDRPIRFLRETVVHPLDQSTLQNVDATTYFAGRQRGYEQWSQEQRRLFYDMCGDAMQKMGYEIPFQT